MDEDEWEGVKSIEKSNNILKNKPRPGPGFNGTTFSTSNQKWEKLTSCVKILVSGLSRISSSWSSVTSRLAGVEQHTPFYIQYIQLNSTLIAQMHHVLYIHS